MANDGTNVGVNDIKLSKYQKEISSEIEKDKDITRNEIALLLNLIDRQHKEIKIYYKIKIFQKE